VGAVLMSASTVIVAINARLLRLKAERKPEANANPPSDLTPQISKRAYELYEERRRGVQDWEEAEREIRNDEVQAEPRAKNAK
jgi:Cu2+-exporting ATPase